jgi:outer membrane protein OmpA-like peptidoglycan-associated protein
VSVPAVQAGATGTGLLNESFSTSAVTTDWVMPSGSEGVCLTAGTNTSAAPIPDCGAGQSSGALQLTNNSGSQVGTVYSDVAVPTSGGLDISWTSYQFDGSGADGISFDLAAVNPTNPTAPSTVGPSGGSLGYSAYQSNDGVPYGYLGFGADVFGNFENSTFAGTGCGQSDAAASESLGVRGPGNGLVGYCLLGQKQLSSPYTLDDKSATSRTSTIGVPEEVVVNTSSAAITAGASGISVPAGDWMFAVKPLDNDSTGSAWNSLEGSLPKSPVGVPSSWLNSTTDLPQDMAFGFAASTGGSNEYHQINDLNVDSITPAPILALSNTDSGSGVLTAGGSGAVTLTPSVASSSAVSESDPVVVTDTFPSSLTPTAASGTDWTCTVAGKTVSCTYASGPPIDAGTSLNPIDVSVTASSAGSFSNTAQATSENGAPATATDSGTIKSTQSITIGSTAPTAALVGGTYDVGASSTSHLAVSLTVDPTSSSVCSISNGVITMLSAGTCLVDANQAGSSSYVAAPQVQQSFAVDATQTVSFTSTAPTAPTPAVVGGSYTPLAVASSGLTPVITIAGDSSSVCSFSAGDTVTFTAGGTCTLYANQAGNSTYTEASEVLQSFSVAKATQSISLSPTAPTDAVVDGPTYAPTATASSGLGVTFTVDASSSNVCAIAGGNVSFVGGGVCTLDANQAGNTAYSAAPQVQLSFEVANTQTVMFTSPTPATAETGGASYTPTATATSLLPAVITVDASSSSICSMSAGVVTFLETGTCILDANQAGGPNGDYTYARAPQVQQSFFVQPPGVITFTSLAPTTAEVDGASYPATATASDADTVTITSDTPDVCVITLGQVSYVDGGQCVLVASDTNPSDLTVSQSFTVANLQTVSFQSSAPGTAVVGGTSYIPLADSSSGLGIIVTVDHSSLDVCTISGGAVTYMEGGVCTLDANQAGGETGGLTYASAVQVQQSFAVNLIPQTILIASVAPTTAVINGTYTPAVTVTSGLGPDLSVDISSDGSCTISGGIVTFAASGTCVLDITQPGNTEYAEATEVQQSFAIAKLTQTVAFDSSAPAPAVLGGTYTPSAIATSGLAVTISVDPSSGVVCSMTSGVVSLNEAGLCVLDANQAGNGQYPVAAQANQAFNVVQTQTVTFTSTTPTNAAYGTLYDAAASATSGLTPAITVDPSSTANTCSINGTTVLFNGAGTCVLDANQSGNANFAAASQTQQSFAVAPAPLTITANSSTITQGGTVALSVTPDGLVGQDAVSGATYTYAGTLGTSYGPSTTAPGFAGVYSITPSDVTLSHGDLANYDITYATGTLTINALPPLTVALNFGTPPSNVTFDGTPSSYSLVATASPNVGTVAYTSATPNVCTVNASGEVTIVGAGTCTIDANDATTGPYASASQISESFSVTASSSSSSGAGTSGSGSTGSGKPVKGKPVKGKPVKGSPGSTKHAKLSLTVDFANDSWGLSAAVRTDIRGLADRIKGDRLSIVTVVGYASSTGTTPGNNVLGTMRADAAATYLKSALANLKVTNVHLTVSADGASGFVASPPSAPANRRAQIEAS